MGLNAKEQMRSYEDGLSTVAIMGASFAIQFWVGLCENPGRQNKKNVVISKRIDLDPEQMVLWWDVSLN